MTNDATDERLVEFTAPDIDPKERIDKFLSSIVDLNMSRTQIQKLIETGKILVNGEEIKYKFKLSGGEQISIKIPPSQKTELVGEDIPFDVVYEDEHMLIVNKPAGLITHPAAGNPTGTLVNAVINYTSDLSSVDPERPGIVHRLDKNTSGLIMVARTDEVHRKLQEALKNREIKKLYHAIVCGHMKEEGGLIDLPIGRSVRDRRKMMVTNIRSRESITEYNQLDRFKLYDYVEINLRTGRTHQIRVHFSHLGHPVLGDPEYGGREKWRRGVVSYDKELSQKVLELIGRQALHAKSLELTHPITGDELKVESDLPEDFSNLLNFLKQDGR